MTKFSVVNMNWKWSLVTFIILLHKAASQFNGCDYFQPLKLGASYIIASPKYPNKYERGTNCRWAAEAPTGYKIALECNDVSLPTSVFCAGDKILVSRTGRTDFQDGIKYCGTGKFSENSSSTRMTIALRAGLFGMFNGRFMCTLKIVSSNCNCGQLNRGRIGLIFLEASRIKF